MSFYETLVTETAAERQALFTVPQIADGLGGRISLETYLAYLGQAYHHVRHTTRLLALAADSLDDTHAVFRARPDGLHRRRDGSRALDPGRHRPRRRRRPGRRSRAPSAPVAAMVAYVDDYVARINAMGMFGMIFVLEGTSVALATQGAEAVARTLNLGPECFTYLSSHGSVDQEHLKFFAGLMQGVDDPDDQAAIIEVAKHVYGLFGDMFRAIPHTRSLAHAL